MKLNDLDVHHWEVLVGLMLNGVNGVDYCWEREVDAMGVAEEAGDVLVMAGWVMDPMLRVVD